MSTYSYSIKQGDKLFHKSTSFTCREVMMRRLLAGPLIKLNEEGTPLEDCTISLVNHAYPNKDRIDEYLGFVALFTQQLVDEIGIAQGRKGPFEIKITKRKEKVHSYGWNPNAGHVRTTSTLPGWVMHNPYFASFYLGVLQVAEDYITTHGVAELNKKKNYRQMLIVISQKTRNHEFPIHSHAGRRVKALVETSKRPTYFKQFLKKKAAGNIYWSPLNGFNQWYDAKGKKIAAVKKMAAQE